MKRELKLSDSCLLTLLMKVVEKGESQNHSADSVRQFLASDRCGQKVFLFTFVTPDKSKSLRGWSGGSLMKFAPFLHFNSL